MKFTAYFVATRTRPDRATILDAWIERVKIERVLAAPEREAVQASGRIRRWGAIAGADGRYLRVVVLADGETVHNAFFDRRFAP